MGGGVRGPFSLEDLNSQLDAYPGLMKFLDIEVFSFNEVDLGKSYDSNNDENNEELEDNENPEDLADNENSEEMDDSEGSDTLDDNEDSGNDWDYSNEDEDNWDAYTDGEYGDYDGPIDPELIGL